MAQSLPQRIRGMSVAWFSFNLATSAIILASEALGRAAGLATLQSLARILAYANATIYIIIAVLFTIKLRLAGREVLEALKHPVKGPFMTAISISTMLLALDWGVVLDRPDIGAVFFYAGLVMHTLLFTAILHSLVMHPGVEVHYMNPGWYMPAVGNVLVPYIGGVLASKGVAVPHSLLGVYLGTGVMFWVALFAIWLYRSIFHHPPPGRLIAATWINLAPPSVAPMAYESLLGFMPHQAREAAVRAAAEAPSLAPYLQSFFELFYYTFWGLAGLLFVLILVLTVEYVRRGWMEFAESWWAFVFPVAAYSISTVHLYMHRPWETWLLYYAALLYGITWFFYMLTTAMSVKHALKMRSVGGELRESPAAAAAASGSGGR